MNTSRSNNDQFINDRKTNIDPPLIKTVDINEDFERVIGGESSARDCRDVTAVQ